MSGSENGMDDPERSTMIPPRSASPAKRSAVEMEDGGTEDRMDTQDATLPSSLAASSIAGISSANTSATSFQSERSPAVSVKDLEDDLRPSPEIIPSLDEQVNRVQALAQQSLGEGDRGVVVSIRWLVRVLARTSDGQNSSEYPKEAREGDIGRLDNADIVAEGGFTEPILKDKNDTWYIPLKRGLSVGDEIEILPYEAYGLIVGWYGSVAGQKPIIRYAHNTASGQATSTNIQYELYPPVFTIRKVPLGKGASQESDKARSVTMALKMKQTRKSCGQMSPDDAVRLVSSRCEKYQRFLLRAKEHAGIPVTTKVASWRLIGETEQSTQATKLIVEPIEWKNLEASNNIEATGVADQTSNDKYNGSSDMQTYLLFDDLTLILVEQSGGDAPVAQRKGVYATKTTATPTETGRTSPAPGIMTRGRALRNGRTRGTVGLQNLGNTCYMNSALQCIRSVEELAVYFLAGRYKQEINASNPLGHKGAMATKYAEVLRGIYNEAASGSFTPSGFKSTLSKSMPTFSGFGQQDSQEFLSFLVDALHEDLNRIGKKPYLENPDSDDKRVNDPNYIVELGEVYRKNHRARNDSIAMDLFSGFYKNTMECPVCDKISITFDPYSLLTLQLPMSTTFTHSFMFFPLAGRPVVHAVDVEKSFTVRDLKRYIASRHDNIDSAKMWMVELYQHKIYKIFDDSLTMGEASIQSADHLFIFELEYTPTHAAPRTMQLYRKEVAPAMDSPKAEILTVPVFHRRLRQANSGSVASATAALHAQYISLTREEAKDIVIIKKKVLIAVSQMTDRSFLVATEDDEDNKVDGVVSDQSDPSDGEYVNVSITSQETSSAAQTSTAAGQVPIGFMDASYHLSDRLSKMLFSLNYGKSSDNAHCAGAGSYEDRNTRPMESRVKQSSRRSSIDSSTTDLSQALSSLNDDLSRDDDEAETTSPAGESPMALPDDTTEEEKESNPRYGRRKVGKGNKFKSGNKHSKEDAAQKREKKLQRKAKQGPIIPSAGREEDTPYYIQVGECIVVDWYTEPFSELFEGTTDPDDPRGHCVSRENGEGLEVVEDPTVQEKRARREYRKKHGITLEDCFSETGKREKLSEDNAWYCNRCKELRQATKTLEIWTLPDILVLHLKRFGGNRRFNDKIDVMVDYPVEDLDLNNKVGLKEDGKNYTYDLFAIDNHFGGLGGGHYTAAARNFFDGKWYDYNDSSCSNLGEVPRQSSAAYLLFYRRRSDKPLGPPYLQELVTKFRNPAEAEESDSGEGLLDDPSSTLLGSSSNFLGAGVTVATDSNGRTAQDANGLSGQLEAGLNQKLKNQRRNNSHEDGDEDEGISMGDDDDDDDDVRSGTIAAPIYGPVRPTHLLGFRDQQPDWGFGNLASKDNDDDSAMIDDDDNNDKASTTAEAEFDGDHMDGYQDPSWNDTETSFALGDDSAVHVEDAGETSEVHEIHLDEA